MQIAPIPGIQVIPAIKPLKNDPMLAAVFDVEGPSGPEQGSFSQTGNMSGGQDGEGAEQEETPETGDETNSGSTVNFFA